MPDRCRFPFTRRPRFPSRGCVAVILLVTTLPLGCSKSDRPPLGRVEGFVTLDGLPLAGAAVLFTPEGPGRTSIGRTDGSGRYRLTYLRDIEGADVGNHAVRITTVSESNRKERLPRRYHAETELAATVQSGGNQFDFALQSKEPPEFTGRRSAPRGSAPPPRP